MRSIHHFNHLATAALLLAALAGCGDKAPNGQGQMPPPEVSVLTVAPERISLITELPGRLEATRVAQVRARVPGVVLQRVFREGADVKAGDEAGLDGTPTFYVNGRKAETLGQVQELVRELMQGAGATLPEPLAGADYGPTEVPKAAAAKPAEDKAAEKPAEAAPAAAPAAAPVK